MDTCLHALSAFVGERFSSFVGAQHNHIQLPQAGSERPCMDALSLSSEKLEPDGVYLLENGVDALVYIGKEAPSAVVQDLLGASPAGQHLACVLVSA